MQFLLQFRKCSIASLQNISFPDITNTQMDQELLAAIWPQIILPIGRITLFIIIGLFVASLIENLNWSHKLAYIARPLIRIGKLSPITGASFAVAFFSGVSANTILAEAFDQKQIDQKELILANLFNSLPRFFLHLPTVFFITFPFIKLGALLYVGLTFSAAIIQTIFVLILGRFIFLKNDVHLIEPVLPEKKVTTWQTAITKSVKRLKKRLGKILKYLIPVYLLFFLLSRYGLFDQLEQYLVSKAWFLSWLNPQSLGIVILHVTTEFSAGLAAASVLLVDNSLTYKEVVLALLAGNILSTPIRAVRHQLPYYSGIYSPGLAVKLVTISQLVRAFCVILVAFLFYFWG